MNQIRIEPPEHPQIENAWKTGYPSGEPKWPVCPVCGAETDSFCARRDGEIVGCDECIRLVNAWEVWEDEV